MVILTFSEPLEIDILLQLLYYSNKLIFTNSILTSKNNSYSATGGSSSTPTSFRLDDGLELFHLTQRPACRYTMGTKASFHRGTKAGV